jgi:hypothetical protein
MWKQTILILYLHGLSGGDLVMANPAASVGTPVATITPMPTGTPYPLLSEDEKKKLQNEFRKALSNQKSALNHQERSALKEFKASQSMKQKKWRADQKTARQKFFDEHMSGPERREYVQTYLKKKAEFDESLKAEAVTFKKNWADKKQAMKQAQKEQESQFNSSIAQGVRPPTSIWPTGN